MRPTSKKIIEDIRRLQETVEMIGDNAMNDDGKKRLSDMIAYTCYELRRKYELTSQYFFVAECAAHKKYDREYDE